MRIYVGNVAWETTAERLKECFETVASVASAEITKDRDTGESRGFGFVEIDDEAQAIGAVQVLHGVVLDGRPLTVNEARPKTPRGGGRQERRG